ncbi:MAG: threonine--tRNA ligase [Candidatus Buchananbacteria bacterium RBG_13_39_9]|uniref:Threonine--tRNA ligase n=1 Tax=Candidatus Buchananbacteria bacterium RBG_13_39_9 TaxID=1797531 RepID=A0A1G1XRX4_9BACT|nr:MAG: threonine--tRNA ligase [Candidatus Buchananbacteria bacterium RBG_13_39_9]
MENEKLDIMRHSASHIMAAAVKSLFKNVKFAIGPTIEEGFYYDFDLGKMTLSAEDLPKIEAKMQEIINANLIIKRNEISIKEALKKVKGQPYKSELIKDLEKEGASFAKASDAKEKKVSFYKIGDVFDDLCRGPHVKSTKEIGVFKLLRVSGAYWRGDEKNKMLQRIYGTAFETQKELDEYLKMLEEAEKRDHRKLGKELDLFSFHDEAPGFPFWHPKGMVLRGALMELHDRFHKNYNYKLVSTPILLSEELWHQSGHWDNYKDKMYFTKIDNRTFAIKPMNCPGVILIYKERPRSYRDLPLRFAENGEVHRHEPSGTLHGLFRVRAFRQDDAHIFAQKNQIEEEITNTIKMILGFYKIFHFDDSEIELSTRPEKSIGSDEMWEESEATLKKVLNILELKFRINEGDGAFYGPKIDFHIKDSLGRSWQCGTIQLDFSMPERFELEYIDNEGQRKRPVMIHRTVIGSIQRFVGILIEHYAGAFPLWLAPVQIKILPVSDKFLEYALEVKSKLNAENVRVELDDSAESLGKKIRNGEKEKVPYLLIIGEKEVNSKLVAVRQRGKGDLGPQDLDEFIKQIKDEILNHK